MCPPAENRPENCRTCCCKASDYAEFYHPNAASQPKCTATEVADYKVSLIPSINSVCHSSYPFFGGVRNSYFSDLLLTTHGPGRVFDSCGDRVLPNVLNYLLRTEELLPTTRALLKSEVEEGIIHDYYLGPRVLEEGKRKRRSARIDVSPSAPYLTFISKLVRLDFVAKHWSCGMHLLSSLFVSVFSCRQDLTISGWGSVDSTSVGQMDGRTVCRCAFHCGQ